MGGRHRKERWEGGPGVSGRRLLYKGRAVKSERMHLTVRVRRASRREDCVHLSGHGDMVGN